MTNNSLFLTHGSIARYPNAAILWSYTQGASNTQEIAVIKRSTYGAWYLVRESVVGDWVLHWVNHTVSTTNNYAVLRDGIAAGRATYIETMRVCQLPAPWDTDYGIATQRLAGARSPGDTFTHEADGLIEYIQTALCTTSTTKVRFRQQDNSNHWLLSTYPSGTLYLGEKVDGVNTWRGNTGACVVNGSRVVLVLDDIVIKVFVDDVLKLTYSSASNFKTCTNGIVESLGGGPGQIDDLVTWPRTLSGAALAELEKYV